MFLGLSACPGFDVSVGPGFDGDQLVLVPDPGLGGDGDDALARGRRRGEPGD